MLKLKTVDVWDTLLRRNCHPECIKLSTARYLLFRFHRQIPANLAEQWAIYRLRLQIEGQLAATARAAGGDDEYTLNEVIGNWLAALLGKNATSQLCTEVAEYELSTEITQSFPDGQIEDLLKRDPAEKTIFLSDFYMGDGMLRQLLSAKGLSDAISSGISSSDVGFNKRSGRLFQYVHELHGVAPEDHLHIGDNIYSDVEVARRLGIKTIHYVPEDAHGARMAREKLFASREVLFGHLRSETLQMVENRIEGMSATHGAAFRLGAEAAPLFIGFAQHVAERAIIDGVERLYFFTREGEFFHRIFDILFRDRAYFGHQVPSPRILEVSRLATFAPSMRNVTIQELDRIWALYRSQRVAGLFATLGLKEDSFADLLAQIGLSAQEVIESPQDDPRLERLFASPDFLAAASNLIAEQRALLIDYLCNLGFPTTGKVGVVDIGWRGTIQDNIAHIFPDTAIVGYYLGLKRMINKQPGNVTKRAYGIDEQCETDAGRYFEAFAPLEMICGSPNGSVEGYVQEGDRVVARRNVCTLENQSFRDFTAHFQDGVALAATAWKPYLEHYVIASDEVRGSALQVWQRLSRSPTEELVKTFLRSPQHDVFGFGDFYSRNQAPSILEILSMPVHQPSRRRVIDFIRRMQWTSAVRHLNGIGWFHKQLLLTLFQGAHMVKRNKDRIRRRWKN